MSRARALLDAVADYLSACRFCDQRYLGRGRCPLCHKHPDYDYNEPDTGPIAHDEHGVPTRVRLVGHEYVGEVSGEGHYGYVNERSGEHVTVWFDELGEADDEPASYRLGECENPGCDEPVRSVDDYVKLQHGYLHERCTTRGSGIRRHGGDDS